MQRNVERLSLAFFSDQFWRNLHECFSLTQKQSFAQVLVLVYGFSEREAGES